MQESKPTTEFTLCDGVVEKSQPLGDLHSFCILRSGTGQPALHFEHFGS